MRLFRLRRSEDPTGISGTGYVAEGAVFDNGWVAMRWLSDRPSLVFYTSIEDLEAVHGHDGRTQVVYVAEER